MSSMVLGLGSSIVTLGIGVVGSIVSLGLGLLLSDKSAKYDVRELTA